MWLAIIQYAEDLSSSKVEGRRIHTPPFQAPASLIALGHLMSSSLAHGLRDLYFQHPWFLSFWIQTKLYH